MEEVIPEILEDEAKVPLFLLLDQLAGAKNLGGYNKIVDCCGIYAIQLEEMAIRKRYSGC